MRDRCMVGLLLAVAHAGCGEGGTHTGADTLPTSAPAPAGAAAIAAGAGGALSPQPVAQTGGSPSAAPTSGASGAPPTAGAGAGAGDAGLDPRDAGQPDASSAPEPVSCPATALAAGQHEGSVRFQGRARTYVLHVPRGYTGAEPVALVFDFHGYGSSGAGQMGASGFRELAEERGFVGVYPDGVGASWHVNGCCGEAAQQNLDEVGAVRAILAQVKERICVDPRRIYASGISQGGGMAHHVGCLAADLFAAIAPVSSDLRTEPCAPARPISELSFRGTADSLSAYEGGPVGPPGMQYQSIGARATLERWRMIDGCSGTPETADEVCETYTQCTAGVEVTLCSIPGGGHVLYSNPSGLDIARVAFAMFERQPL